MLRGRPARATSTWSTAIATSNPSARRSNSAYSYAYTYDGSGNLLSRSRSQGGTALGTTHYKFDSRGRLVCAGSQQNLCNVLAVTYNGAGERVKEAGASNTFLFAGPSVRLKPEAGVGGQQYWIEIEALGERVAYKWVMGGALRATQLLPPGFEISPRVEGVRVAAGAGRCHRRCRAMRSIAG